MSKGSSPQNLPGALRLAVKEALEMGWTAKRGGSGWKLRSPGGTQWMHVAPATNIPDQQARQLRTLIAKAVLTESTPESVEFQTALDDVNDPNATVTCAECDQEFMTWDGYAAHQEPCRQAWSARREADQAITPATDERPSEGRTEHPEQGEVEVPKSPDSDRLNIKEEVVTESTNTTRGGYSWNVVKPGIARALYTAMMSRSRHKGEATSTYANVLAEIIEEMGLDFATPPVLTDAQKKLDEILGLLGVNAQAMADAEILRAENERLRANATALKDLITGL